MKIKTFIFVAAGLILAGCAQAPRVPDVQALFDDAAFRPPAGPVDGDVFALSATMRDYLASDIEPRARREGRRQGLLDALRKDIHLDYDATMTRTAAQAFAARAGNCLSLVLMTAAFARQLDIPVTYQQVFGYDTWSRSDGLTFRSGHVNLVLGPPQPRIGLGRMSTADPPLIVDFLPPRDVAGAITRPLREATVVAMYRNNRAAEVLAAGDVNAAYWWVRAAIASDPTFVSAYNTLGVIYQRHGNLPAAEHVLRYAMSREPDSVLVLSNLASVLQAQGKNTQADRLLKRLAEIERHPPFYFFDQGMAALARGDYRGALALFGKELARRPYDDQVHFAMAMAEAGLGHLRRARRQLQLAEQNSTTRERRALYAAKLASLKSL